MNKRIYKYAHIFTFIFIFQFLLTAGGYEINTVYAFNTYKQLAAITASDGSAYDGFGTSVDIDGNYAVIGSPYHNSGRGSAYIFKKINNDWIQQAKLVALDGAANDKFGVSVSISNDTVVIGAVNENSGQGAAYIFVRFTGGGNEFWQQQAKLTASDGSVGDEFGNDVDVDGNSVIVGAYRDNIVSNENQGSAYVFRRITYNWVQQQKLVNSNGTSNDQFGNRVAISGDKLIVGSHSYSNDSNYQGSAIIFENNGGSWSEQQHLIPSGSTNFGWDVDIDGDTAIVSSATFPYIFPSLNERPVYVFVQEGNSWTEQATLTDAESADREFVHFGRSIAVDGNKIVVGAPSDHDHGSLPGWDGEAHIFFRSIYNNVWFNQQVLTAEYANGFGHAHALGRGVGISGNNLIASDPEEGVHGNEKQGTAYIFRNFPYVLTSENEIKEIRLFLYPKFRFIWDKVFSPKVPSLATFEDGRWNVWQPEGDSVSFNLGSLDSVPVPADYDGNGLIEAAVYENGRWSIRNSNGEITTIEFGREGDIPVAGFFDNDEKADFAVFNRGVWSLSLTHDRNRQVSLGNESSQPFAGDYDGDGIYDLSVFEDGTWEWISSRTGRIETLRIGERGDIPIAEDFDGDGIADLGVYRQGLWITQQSREGYKTIEFGRSGDTPVPSDYDGDGKADAAVYRNGVWAIEQSSAGYAQIEFGSEQAIPVSGQ